MLQIKKNLISFRRRSIIQWRIQDFARVDVERYYFAIFFQNCMKLKEFGPGGRVPSARIKSTNVVCLSSISQVLLFSPT